MEPQETTPPFSGLETDFAKGYQNGLAAIEPERYREYLENTIAFENISEQIIEKKAEKISLENSLTQLLETSSLYHDRLQLHTQHILVQQQKRNRFQHTLDKTDAETERYETEKQKVYSHYSIIAGVLFVAAGVVFMAGDLIISHEIVAYALNIRNTFEAWAFAGGLAALSILFKPAYDRLFEQPWHEENRPKNTERNYIIMKGVVIGFALVTLFVLGWFRFEAYRINEQKSQLNKVITSLQSEEMSPETLKQVESLLGQQQTLGRELVSSLWGLFSFVLTGILFAVSGAICLGIGLPILQYFWRRWVQVPLRLNILKIRQQKYARKVEKSGQIVAWEQARLKMCEYELGRQKDISWLENQIQVVKNELENLQNKKMTADVERRIALYTDGYDNGYATQELNAEGAAHVSRKSTKTLLEGEDKSFIIKDVIKRSQPKNRPHLALRQMIADNNLKN